MKSALRLLIGWLSNLLLGNKVASRDVELHPDTFDSAFSDSFSENTGDSGQDRSQLNVQLSDDNVPDRRRSEEQPLMGSSLGKDEHMALDEHMILMGSFDPNEDDIAPEVSEMGFIREKSTDDGHDTTDEGPYSNTNTSQQKPPRQHGSRRIKRSGGNRSSTKSPRPPQPELVCREDIESCLWQIVLTMEGGLTEVRQNGGNLPIENGECVLPSFAGMLSISCQDSSENIDFQLLDTKTESRVTSRQIMIFKLSGNSNSDGRRVPRLTNGSYIVIAPKSFRRLGDVPVEPGFCQDDRFTAHYFFCEPMSSEETESRGFEELLLERTTACFELEGSSIFEDAQLGKLFVGVAPTLRTVSGIVWARVGEERQGGWKGENFDPNDKTLAEVLNDHQGRFFIRVYDNDTKLIDSGEFRYFKDLREIRIDDEPYTASKVLLPGSNGHSTTTVSFVGAEETMLQVEVLSKSSYIRTQEDTIVAHPHVEGDCIEGMLYSDEARVDIVLHLPRVWWRLDGNEISSCEWQSTPFSVTREDFRALTKSEVRMWLRLPQRIKAAYVGANNEVDRRYPRNKYEEDIAISLRDFIDYEQIANQPYEKVSLNARFDDATFTFMIILADPLPTIVNFSSDLQNIFPGEMTTLRWTIRNAEANGVMIEPDIGQVEVVGSVDICPTETTAYTMQLTAEGMDEITETVTVEVTSIAQDTVSSKVSGVSVKSAYGWRRGKGFSHGELAEAGLTPRVASINNLPLDGRRRSVHPSNISKIKELSNVSYANEGLAKENSGALRKLP